MAGTIWYEATGGIARLVLDHEAKRNAMSFEMWSMLPGLVARADADPEVRLLVIAGAGETAFCAGADISQFNEKRTGADAADTYGDAVSAAYRALSGTAKPTLASIRGICFGGGMALALCCSLLVASDDSRFRIPAGRLGLGYGFGAVESLVHRLGPGVTADILLTARVVGADEALRLGILQRVFPRDGFADGTKRLEVEIAANAPLTLAAVKRALNEIERPPGERDVAAVEALVARCFASDDYREGQAAFLERRTPCFSGT